MSETTMDIIGNAMLIIVPIIIGLGFIFIIAMIISPKLRGKMMSREIRAQKYMVEESKQDIKSISDNVSYATKDGIKTTVGAIKEGLTQDKIFCKYCGNEIDSDSLFCKKCGKKQ